MARFERTAVVSRGKAAAGLVFRHGLSNRYGMVCQMLCLLKHWLLLLVLLYFFSARVFDNGVQDFRTRYGLL